MSDKKEWKSDLIKLNQQIDRYEVGLKGVIKKHDDFSRYSSSSAREIEDVRSGVSRKLRSFRNGLSSIQTKLHEFTHAVSNVESMQGILESFEGKISTYKRSMREDFGRMIEEEGIYTRDCETMLKRIEDWEVDEPPQSPLRRRTTAKTKQDQKADIKERYDKDMARQARIGAIDRELTMIGGRTGGWESNEHDTFLKIWTQTITSTPVTKQQRAVMVRRTTPMLPAKTADDVDDHILFWTNYLDLTEQKKRVMLEWKEARAAARHRAVAGGLAELEGGGLVAAHGGVEDVFHKMRGSAERKMSEAASDEAKMKTKAKIAKWKQDRTMKQQADEEARELEAREAKKAELEERNMFKKANKLRLETWRRNEAEKQARLAAAKEVTTRPRTTDPAFTERRKARDDEMLKRQKDMRDAAEKKRTARERRQRELEEQHEFKSDVPITRDVDRLLAPTTAYESAKITKEQLAKHAEMRKGTSAHSSYMPGSGRDLSMGGKARASWMTGGY